MTEKLKLEIVELLDEKGAMRPSEFPQEIRERNELDRTLRELLHTQEIAETADWKFYTVDE